MPSRLFRFIPLVLPLTLVAATLPKEDARVGSLPELAPEVVTVSKAAVPLSESARAFLLKRDGSTCKAWVYFTDKGVFTRTEFQSAAATTNLGSAAMKRRAKTGTDRVLFADLPVRQDYVDQVVAAGATVRWESKWLNAASFVIPFDKLDAVGRLPFVASIQPVALGKRVGDTTVTAPGEPKSGTPSTTLSPSSLGYGSSASQLGQINVPPVHDKGYHGEGVTLAVFDCGFRTSHEVFAATLAEGRLLAQYDFVFGDSVVDNQANDWVTAWSHGTSTWSAAAGAKDGVMYGPAYKSKIILCKTEDIRSEKPIEEDNWLAAVEWVSGLGADVISSSLSYSAFDSGTSYVDSNYNGKYCISTKAANIADSLGILVVNAAGNSGPTSPSIGAPADALRDVTVGAVNSSNTLASFSSRGPTYDGRIKPEVCARGVSAYLASSTTDNSYGGGSGTSFATPLVAGAACLLIQAHPSFPPWLIRQSMMETANNAASPNNDYGWGILNADAALMWGASISSDITQGNAPLMVQFTGTSSASLSPSSWLWHFGDGQTSALQSPSHVYSLPGAYDVSLTVQTAYGPIATSHPGYIVALGDTIRFIGDSAFAGKQVMASVHLSNSQSLRSMTLPIRLPNTPYRVQLDSLVRGTRTSYFEGMNTLSYDSSNNRYTIQLVTSAEGTAPLLAPGEGEVMRIFGHIDQFALGGVAAPVDTADLYLFRVNLSTGTLGYGPIVIPGAFTTKNIKRCDVDYSNDGKIDISDITYLINYLYLNGPPAKTVQSADCDADHGIDISDLTVLIGYLYLGGDPPVNP